MSAREAAQAIGRRQAARAQPGDDALIEQIVGADLALLVHCGEADGERVTLVIGVKNWMHAAACIASPAIADDLSERRLLFEIVPMRMAGLVRHPLARQ